MGRFISPDTIVPDQYNPQSLNRYVYCLNNPLIYVDPSGHYPRQWDDPTCKVYFVNPDADTIADAVKAGLIGVTYWTNDGTNLANQTDSASLKEEVLSNPSNATVWVGMHEDVYNDYKQFNSAIQYLKRYTVLVVNPSSDSFRNATKNYKEATFLLTHGISIGPEYKGYLQFSDGRYRLTELKDELGNMTTNLIGITSCFKADVNITWSVLIDGFEGSVPQYINFSILDPNNSNKTLRIPSTKNVFRYIDDVINPDGGL